MMIPLLLLAAAFGSAAVLLLVLLVGRYTDRGVRLAHADQTIAVLQEQLDRALAQQENLTQRIQNLEAIVTSEAWDAFQEQRMLEARPSLTLPDEPSDEEKAALLAQRRRSS